MMIARDRDEKTWWEAIHKDDREWWLKRLEDAFNTKVHLPIEYRVVDTSEGFYNDKKVKWVVSEVLPVFDEDTGKLQGFYSTVADITPLKLAEATQKERADEALERTRQQERFIDMTCHELRNPLSAILQYSELILDLLDDHEKNEGKPINVDTITEACNTIILCTTHQRRIIDDILVTSKLDSGLVRIEPVDFQPAKYLEKSLKMYDAESQSKGIDLSIVIERSYRGLEVDWVKGDPARIMQILSNLMTNSIKFTTGQKKKTIMVYLAASEEEPTSYGDVEFFKDENSEVVSNSGSSWGSGDTVYLIVTVRDSGIGIPQDVQQTLFARFQQAPKTETKYGGSGKPCARPVISY
jgi:signal transduction histidine kinase